MTEHWQFTEAESDDLARRLKEAIDLDQATFERVGEAGLSKDELRDVVRETTARFRSERHVGAGTSVRESEGAGRRSRPPRKPLSETTGDERRRAIAEAADALLPSLPGGAVGAPSTLPAPEKAPHEMSPAEFSAFKAAHANQMLPGGELGPPDPRGTR